MDRLPFQRVKEAKASEIHFLELLLMKNGIIKCVNPKIILMLQSSVHNLATQL
jgi:hypothetical protein